MGQTLTHGIYLPDEGERNCYAGLAANWQLLDSSVGTIAEHTSALSGKAPLVHTHSKSDITDFPAYGTTAGTICEGNDSRLSDARTPVAHTHTKADVTDLLNSSFIPSANNTYDLGSSSYQWNNLYAKNYFYNGVAWGLDKENVWSKTQDFIGENQGTEFSANYRTCFAMYGRSDTVGKSGMFFTKFRPYKAQGSLDPSDVIQYGVDVLENEVRTNNVFDLQASGYDSNTGKFTKIDVVSGLSDANLGTSTNKWKTLNGINPGALSLPDYSKTMTIDTTNWPKDGNKIIYTPTVNGWLQITIPNDDDNNGIKSNMISILDSGTNPISGIANGNSNDLRIYCSFPVIANREYWIYIKSYSNTITTARIVQCQGNV